MINSTLRDFVEVLDGKVSITIVNEKGDSILYSGSVNKLIITKEFNYKNVYEILNIVVINGVVIIKIKDIDNSTGESYRMY